MKEKEKVIAQTFADFVNNNYEKEMKGMYQFVKHFGPEECKSESEFMFEMGYISALNWIGDLLEIDLAKPTEEERAIIDELFETPDKGYK